MNYQNLMIIRMIEATYDEANEKEIVISKDKLAFLIVKKYGLALRRAKELIAIATECGSSRA